MLMVPTGKPAGQFTDLPLGPHLVAGTLWEGRFSPEAIKQRALSWIRAVVRPVRVVTVALEAIAWAQGLPFLRKILAADDWRALVELLTSLSAEVDQQVLQEQPLIHQLLAAELAWTIARRLPDTPLSGRLAKSGRARISMGLSQILDRQGMPPAKHFRGLRSLLACWTRCRGLAGGLPGQGWGVRSEQRFQRLVRNALRCSRPDGWPLLAEHAMNSNSGGAWGRDLFETVLEDGAEETDRRLAAVALPPLTSLVAAKRPKKSAVLPPASICFEDGAIAILRRNWDRDNERLAVLFPERNCEIELVCSGRVAASGAWRFEISQQGQQLQGVSNWESNCWHSDADVDYLELEIEVTGGVKLQRQIVLARQDRFLLLADAVMSPQRGNLEYRSVVPLAPKVEFRGAVESREGLLVHCPKHQRFAALDRHDVESREESLLHCPAATDPAAGPGRAAHSPERLIAQSRAAAGGSAVPARPLAQVMPLAMPEWRAERSGGELIATPEGLELRHTTAGQRLFAPLFIDLDRSRFRRRMTWRQLTVAESLAAVPSDVAVGYRVAVGDRQWIIYRSLAAKANRTVLGHNLATESLIARFGKDGEVTSIIEIE